MLLRTLAVAALLATTAATAQAPAPAADEFDPARFRAHVTFLADDLLEGREAGTRGYQIAANYVAQQFAALGLQPAGDKGAWFQQVRLRERSLVDNDASLALIGPRGTQRWKNGEAAVVGPDSFDAKRAVEAPVVFAGYGLDAPAQGFDDYRGLDVKGKIVAMFGGTPKGTPSELGAHLGATKAKMAEARGAVGIITLGTMQDEKVSPWKTVVRYGTQPRMSWVHPDGRTYTLAPGVVASASLDTPAAELLFAGAPQSFQQLRAAADRPKARLKGFALPTRARIERATAFKDVTSPNVAAMLEGSDPKLRNEVVVLMAHLDHLGVRSKNEGDKIYNGAMDNAAGIATMLEVARAVAAERPKRSVLFLAVTAEEKGLLGADFFAHYPTVPLERVVGLVNLDMPILTYSFTDVIAFGAEHSTLGQAVASAAGKVGVKLSPDPMPEEGIFTRSDHYAFVKKGVPSVFFATGWANGGEKVWKDFLANKYHQPNDDLNLPINWQAGARFARINYLLTREIADAPGRPRWYRGNFFGETFAPGAEKAARAGK